MIPQRFSDLAKLEGDENVIEPLMDRGWTDLGSLSPGLACCSGGGY